jgi:hypothetical protein
MYNFITSKVRGWKNSISNEEGGREMSTSYRRLVIELSASSPVGL